MNLKLPNGQFFIPSENNLNSDLGYNSLTFGPKTTFKADQVSGNIDYNVNGRDRLTGKYYFQNDPTFAPFAISQVGNFPQQLSAGSHLLSIQNTTTVSPNAVWTQGFGFIREKAFAHTIDGYTNSDYGLNIFGLSNVPGISIGSGQSEHWLRPRHRPFQQLRQRRHVPEHLRRFHQIFLDRRPPHHRRRRADRSQPAQHHQQKRQSGLARLRHLRRLPPGQSLQSVRLLR